MAEGKKGDDILNKQGRNIPVNKRLVCALIIIAVFIFIGYRYAHYLYSPGNLSKAHKNLKRCSECHAAFGGILDKNCENCHSETEMKTKASSGVIDLHKKVKGKACKDCHPEHLGTEGIIVKKVVHKGLKGDACRNCHELPQDKLHKDMFMDETASGLAPVTRGLFSVDEVLAAEQPSVPAKLHSKGSAFDCLACHTTNAWKPARFDHKDLKGFACLECHKFPEEKLHKVISAKMNNKDCASCHTANKWKPAKFEHKGIDGKLCIECHKLPDDKMHPSIFKDISSNSMFERVLQPDKRLSGTLMRYFAISDASAAEITAENKKGGDCLVCHTTTKWKPSTFEHNKYYPLFGFHKDASCKECHGGKERLFKGFNCYTCHTHQEKVLTILHQKAGLSRIDNCLACHKGGFYDHSPVFLLAKPHESKECFLCHDKTKGNYNNFTCYGCHAHQPEGIRQSHLKLGIPDYERCLMCHRSSGKDGHFLGTNLNKK